MVAPAHVFPGLIGHARSGSITNQPFMSEKAEELIVWSKTKVQKKKKERGEGRYSSSSMLDCFSPYHL